MRKLFLALLLLLASVAAAIWFRNQDGFIILRVGELAIQTSLFVAVGAVLAGWLLLGIALGVLRRLWRAPRGVRRSWRRRRELRARRRLMSGLLQLAEGRYREAERTLAPVATASDLPLFHYLLAAIAAQREGDWSLRDRYLAEADAADGRARLAVGLLQAQLQIEAEQWEEALATLSWLRERAPGNRRALALLARCLQALDDQPRLGELLPELRRQRALPEPELTALERRQFETRMQAFGPNASAEDIARVWEALPRSRQREPALRAAYARALMRADCHATAEQLLRGWLRESWEEPLVAAYGELAVDPPERAFERIEGWLRSRPEEPALLFAAARQAARCELWGRARSYLEAAASRTGHAEVHRMLAELYERLGETERARRAYRRAIGLDPGRNSLPPIELPADLSQG